ncbi:RhoGAP-domain-containing protein, partial [Sistotremastrum suecicum HHB10207 ss-3]
VASLQSIDALRRPDVATTLIKSLKDVIANGKAHGAKNVKLDVDYLGVMLTVLDGQHSKNTELKSKVDQMKRTSQQYIEGLSASNEEYDRELATRRDFEEEVKRLRVLVAEQNAKLATLGADQRRRELMERTSKELTTNLHGLEQDVSKLKAERDMILAEVEELSASKSSEHAAPPPSPSHATLSRSLTTRFDGIKSQYRKELEPLIQQKESLAREINELKEVRDSIMEETTALNARNEELSDLNTQIARKLETSVPTGTKAAPAPGSVSKPKFNSTQSAPNTSGTNASFGPPQSQSVDGDDKTLRAPKPVETHEHHTAKVGKFKWYKAGKENTAPRNESLGISVSSEKGRLTAAAHNFSQMSILRMARCDHCSDKMWGSQLRCQACGLSVHARCVNNVQGHCASQPPSPGYRSDDSQVATLGPSMFGRNLIEQVRSEEHISDRAVPIIVEKCIEAVEALGMEYEGIYRKTGGTSETKSITVLFERGRYDSFDLKNQDSFNDISSVTSVLKSYFRALPDPLLTYALHETFMDASSIREPAAKSVALTALVNQLPREHYETVRLLMLHLHRIQEKQAYNRMDSKNLGVVFGPTLMRSSDPSREFSDMAGKAVTIQWLVLNAPEIFA